MQVDPHRSGRGQADPPRLDDERRRMMSRACCAGPSVCCAGRSVPEGANEHGALPGQVDPHRSCRVQGDRVMRDYLLASSKLN